MSKKDYYIRGNGIHEDVVAKYVADYLGPDAVVSSGVYPVGILQNQPHFETK